jgi:hypothetical protein
MTTPSRRQVHYVPWRVLPAKSLEQVIAYIEQRGEDGWPEIGLMRQRLYDLKLQEFEPANTTMH